MADDKSTKISELPELQIDSTISLVGNGDVEGVVGTQTGTIDAEELIVKKVEDYFSSGLLSTTDLTETTQLIIRDYTGVDAEMGLYTYRGIDFVVGALETNYFNPLNTAYSDIVYNQNSDFIESSVPPTIEIFAKVPGESPSESTSDLESSNSEATYDVMGKVDINAMISEYITNNADLSQDGNGSASGSSTAVFTALGDCIRNYVFGNPATIGYDYIPLSKMQDSAYYRDGFGLRCFLRDTPDAYQPAPYKLLAIGEFTDELEAWHDMPVQVSPEALISKYAYQIYQAISQYLT